MSQIRIRRKKWCFTLNNYSDEEFQFISDYLRTCTNYFIIGKEVGDQGTPHLQGYISFKEVHSLVQVKASVSQRAHFEASRGTDRDNQVYCSKGGDFIEEGNPSGESRKRTRDELAKEWRGCLESGRLGISKFADDNPGVFAWSGHTLLRNSLGLSGAIPRPDISVRWVYGPPGVGKSRMAHDEWPNAYIKDPRTKWWNGYLLEKEVIIDDFGPNGIDINHLLRWFDRYKCYVEVKGDMCPLLADKFIVTSNFHPEEVFVVVKNYVEVPHPQLSALLRRIELIKMD